MANEAQTLLHDTLLNSLTVGAYNELKARFRTGHRFHDVMRKPEMATHGELLLISDALNTDVEILMDTFRLATDNMSAAEITLHEKLRYYKTKAEYAPVL